MASERGTPVDFSQLAYEAMVRAVEAHTVPGADRDLALAIANQARLGRPLDEIQATHLLAIGSRAGRRQAAEAIRATIVAGAPMARWLQPGGKPKAADLAEWAARIAEGQVADG